MLLRRLIVLLLTWLPLAASAQEATTEPAGHSLSGAVHDAKGQPVVGAWLELRGTQLGAITASTFEGAPFKSMRSGPDGRWAFQRLPAGTWLLTAVAKTEPTAVGAALPSDEEFQAMARPGADHRLPENVAVTRLIRHFGPGQAATSEQLDLGLALGPRPDRPLFGQLVAGFHPDKYGYEVRLARAKLGLDGVSVSSSVTSFGGGTITSTATSTNTATGTTTTSSSTIVDGVSDPPDPRFSVVPDSEGHFDFGSLHLTAEDWVSVEGFPLSGSGPTAGGSVFGAAISTFEPWPSLGIKIAIETKHTVTVRAALADGTPLTGKEWVQGSVWSEDSVSTAAPLAKSGWEMELSEGTYLARATLGDSASSLTAFKVDANGPTEVTLLLKPCPPFTVRLVDGKGAPLGDCYPKLGTEVSRDFPSPCRVPIQCKSGEVKLEGILPGAYDVRFKVRGKEAFTQRIELKPGDTPVTVTLP